MKKLMFIAVVLTLFSVAASAQQASGERFRKQRVEDSRRNGDFNDREMQRFHKDHNRFDKQNHRGYRDGRISPRERRHMHRMHRHERRDLHRARHHRSHRHF